MVMVAQGGQAIPSKQQDYLRRKPVDFVHKQRLTTRIHDEVRVSQEQIGLVIYYVPSKLNVQHSSDSLSHFRRLTAKEDWAVRLGLKIILDKGLGAAQQSTAAPIFPCLQYNSTQVVKTKVFM
ncbi:hypothetical protein CIHG_08309 [Coccidioides immitis H538.4]|uniref:Uncharacterized protein n=1 Tax=Coccidioides immitis H538.4 TaxID=396776 RepID=A0A0J8USD3_COCIT|nr:hypothetical protein CIHG_08309 [Coccidioides immitis H538.4]